MHWIKEKVLQQKLLVTVRIFDGTRSLSIEICLLSQCDWGTTHHAPHNKYQTITWFSQSYFRLFSLIVSTLVLRSLSAHHWLNKRGENAVQAAVYCRVSRMSGRVELFEVRLNSAKPLTQRMNSGVTFLAASSRWIPLPWGVMWGPRGLPELSILVDIISDSFSSSYFEKIRFDSYLCASQIVWYLVSENCKQLDGLEAW